MHRRYYPIYPSHVRLSSKKYKKPIDSLNVLMYNNSCSGGIDVGTLEAVGLRMVNPHEFRRSGSKRGGWSLVGKDFS